MTELEKIFIKAIEKVKQEPCDDAISRQAVLDIVNNPLNIRLDAIIKKLPSVTQKSETVTEFADRCRECGAKYGKLLEQKSGKWRRVSIDKYTTHAQYWYECDKCGEQTLGEHNYCPNCGANMEVENG